MTDETRAELRRGIEAVVRLTKGSGTPELAVNVADPYHPTVSLYDQVKLGNSPLPELTTAQQLALSVLLGDEAVLPQALADYLLDQGHEYATACYERGKRDGNPFNAIVKAMANGVETYADLLRSLPRLTPLPFPEDGDTATTPDGDGWPRWMSSDTATPPG